MEGRLLVVFALFCVAAAWIAGSFAVQSEMLPVDSRVLVALPAIGLFLHLAGFVIGLGSVTVIDLLGALGRDSCYWTEATIRAHKVTKPLIWVGIALAVVGGALWHGAWTQIATAQALIAIALTLNGCFLTFVVSPFLLERESLGCARELLPAWMQRRVSYAFIISFISWWSALALTVAALV